MSIGKIGTLFFVFALIVAMSFAQETPGAPQPPQAPADKASMLPEGKFAVAVIASGRLDGVRMAERVFRGGIDLLTPPEENFTWFWATLKIKITCGNEPTVGLRVDGIHAVDSAGQKHELVGLLFFEEKNKKTFKAVEQWVGHWQAKIKENADKTVTTDFLWGIQREKNPKKCTVLTAGDSEEIALPENQITDAPLIFLVENATQTEATMLFQVPISLSIVAIQLMPGKEFKVWKPKSNPQKGTPKKT